MTYNFDIEIATRIGVDEAIMLNNFVYWLLKNKANNKNFFDGNYWTFNSVRAYSELFPFWNETQIRRILKSLIDQNVLVVGNYNQNAYDRTNWYSLSNEYIYLIDLSKNSNGSDNNITPIPNNKPNRKTNNIKSDISHKPIKEKKQNNYQLFISYLKEKCKYKTKASSTKNGEIFFNQIEDKKQLAKDYIQHQLEKKEYAVVITKFMEDYNTVYKDKYNPNNNNNDEWDYGITRCDPNEYR